ncbi:hypothetical protein CC85DRAFT_287030 [Cutaneotrichosporon oleaginosum]|uniref:Secreted protein n=1 Tax=Cutaneotrichosporon oleaginosum TaxID=879819 RepID=A0A0J1AZV5_9TREE|nr:uncharacterized protein CC85DRAFT_287030 [Cutaneotrichosporon oleaginosum]KLT40884.1 hypothetical protein CC85DRAFT_287030 [Cutaneotrichosporon oleaginosum]TXT09257.1 hypothetical protein COLE_03191 [Cutaneotrichosporon oleaginosum]
MRFPPRTVSYLRTSRWLLLSLAAAGRSGRLGPSDLVVSRFSRQATSAQAHCHCGAPNSINIDPHPVFHASSHVSTCC